jgi:hypothetical protein
MPDVGTGLGSIPTSSRDIKVSESAKDTSVSKKILKNFYSYGTFMGHSFDSVPLRNSPWLHSFLLHTEAEFMNVKFR